ncbi:hypothetical protein QUF50_03280, partial [Thiotrichales bacterium HSG1]|nr:hypothetical protein [Thiotrichales bacterium HSG1]
SKYHNQTFVNIKATNNVTRFFSVDNFLSTILEQPIKIEHNQKKLLLSLYRKDGIYVDFEFDKKIVNLLNNSLNENRKAWKEYRSSENAIFGICSTEQLYSLVENCKA